MRKITISLFVIISALLMTSCGGDQEFNVNNDINAKVDGYVFDNETKLPLEGVKVTISNKTATTNAQGYYKIEGLSAGDYPAKLEKEGYASILQMSAVSIAATDFYGDAIQTCAAFYVSPTNKELQLTFRFQKWDDVDLKYKWYNAPKDLKVKVSYTNSAILNQFSVLTTNSNGEVTIPNIAALQNLKIEIDEKNSEFEYYLNTTLSYGTMQSYEYGTIRMEIDKSEVTVADDIDIAD